MIPWSSMAMKMTPLLTEGRVPQVGTTSMNTQVSDPRRFPYFHRVCPADDLQAVAMLAFCKEMKWKHMESYTHLNHIRLALRATSDAYLEQKTQHKGAARYHSDRKRRTCT